MQRSIELLGSEVAPAIKAALRDEKVDVGELIAGVWRQSGVERAAAPAGCCAQLVQRRFEHDGTGPLG